MYIYIYILLTHFERTLCSHWIGFWSESYRKESTVRSESRFALIKHVPQLKEPQ
jgi:hypothetical protein